MECMVYNPSVGLDFNPQRASQILSKEGFDDRSRFPKISISYNTSEDHKMIAENVQAQLKRNLGIEVELKNQEWKTYLKHLQTGKMDIFRMGWIADYPDPDNFLTLMTTSSEKQSYKLGEFGV